MAHPDLLVGTATSDDAGVFRLAPDLALVQTVDFFPPIVDDAFPFGAIAAANALSDVYAMGGEPRTALNIACFPQEGVPHGGAGRHPARRDREGRRGRRRRARRPHGRRRGDQVRHGGDRGGPSRAHLRNVGARPGDALVLTKALGTGIVTTARKRGAGTPEDEAATVASMLALNAAAARALRAFTVHACTDVTGFWLLGHGYEMAHGSGVRLALERRSPAAATRRPLARGDGR